MKKIFVFIVLILLVGCSKAVVPTATQAADPTLAATEAPGDQGDQKVTYRVSGSAEKVLITLGSLEQFSDVALPASLDRYMDSGDHVYISAQNLGVDGSVTCEILINDVVINTNTIEEEFGIASCKGIVE